MQTNIFDHTNDSFWGDLGLDEFNDFNDDHILSEISDVGPDYTEPVENLFDSEE